MSDKVKYQQKSNITEQQSSTITNQPKESQAERRQYNNNRSYNNNGRQNNNRGRYQDKQQRYRNKHGFEYDESKIHYNTEIPEMPEKPKSKPDDAKYNKKIEEMEEKVAKLKKERKEKKDSYKNGSQQFTDQIEAERANIRLAKACLVVLNFDKEELGHEIDEVENKISSHRRKIDLLGRPQERVNRNVKLEEMNASELAREEDRILQEMSTLSLSKAEQAELLSRLNKIKKLKIQLPKDQVQTKSKESDDKQSQIQSHRSSIQRLRHVRETLADRVTDIENKIESIEDDIVDFEDRIEEIHQKLKNTDNSALLEQAAELKKQIYEIWNEMDELAAQHKVKIQEWEYEQEKIKYIEWAKKVKQEKAEAWQLEKAERKRQRLREKDRQKKETTTGTKDEKAKQNGKEGDKTQGTEQKKPEFQRKKINKNQKQIDSCAFLIQYCKDLSSGDSSTSQSNTAQKQVKLEDALKKGEWAKMKNVEVIQPKKKKADEEAETKTYKKRENKNPVVEQTDRFSHTYFVAQVFDSVKVLPPTKQEDLEKVINELEDKMEYYLAHPDEGVETKLLPERTSERDVKRGGNRKVINTEEFPSLK